MLKHPNQGRIVREIQRPNLEIITAFSQCDTAFIADRLGKYGVMGCEIKPISHGMKICGPAITCLGPDRSVRRMAIDLASRGDVIVVGAGGVTDRACFGDTTAKQMILKGIAGIVIDGATRDAAGIRELGFATFVKAITPRNYHYPIEAEYGAANVEICCAGVIVKPGDIIIGDDDGVVVVPKEIAETLSRIIVDELRSKKERRSQMDTYKPFAVEEELKALGYTFE